MLEYFFLACWTEIEDVGYMVGFQKKIPVLKNNLKQWISRKRKIQGKKSLNLKTN